MKVSAHLVPEILLELPHVYVRLLEKKQYSTQLNERWNRFKGFAYVPRLFPLDIEQPDETQDVTPDQALHPVSSEYKGRLSGRRG